MSEELLGYLDYPALGKAICSFPSISRVLAFKTAHGLWGTKARRFGRNEQHITDPFCEICDTDQHLEENIEHVITCEDSRMRSKLSELLADYDVALKKANTPKPLRLFLMKILRSLTNKQPLPQLPSHLRLFEEVHSRQTRIGKK